MLASFVSGDLDVKRSEIVVSGDVKRWGYTELSKEQVDLPLIASRRCAPFHDRSHI